MQKDTANGKLPQSKPAKRARRKPGGTGLKYVVVIDSREQLPYDFGPSVKTITECLETGDYSVQGRESLITVERKSWPDYYGCCASDHRRFSDVLTRMHEIRFADIVVEASMDRLYKPYFIPQFGGGFKKARLPPEGLREMLVTRSRKYGIKFWFAGNRLQATKLTLLLLDNAVRQLVYEEQQSG